MIVAIHQPHFLPWLGYLDRMSQVDLFIVLDHVQFERANYQNRTKIGVNGEARWLTVPVVQHSRDEKVIDKLIDNPPADQLRWWGANHYQTLKFAYREAPYFSTYGPTLKKILESRWRRLVDLDQALLDFLRDALDIRTPLVTSSELNVAGQRSELILNLCKEVGADTYMAGLGGSRNYLDRDAFAQAGIELAWQNFVHPGYPQGRTSSFIPGLSAVDMLFYKGPDSVSLLRPECEESASAAADIAALLAHGGIQSAPPSGNPSRLSA